MERAEEHSETVAGAASEVQVQEKPKRPRRKIVVWFTAVVAVLGFVGGLLQILPGLRDTISVIKDGVFPTVSSSDETDSQLEGEQQPLDSDATPAPESTLTPGWYPARRMYTMAEPADVPAFNSLRDSSVTGDERDFAAVRFVESSTRNQSVWSEKLAVVPGDSVEVLVTVSNAAAENLNDKGTIHGAFAALALFPGSNGVLVQAALDGVNVNAVYDSALLESSDGILAQYEQGSGVFHNSVGKHHIPDMMGTQSSFYLGSRELDGEFRVGSNPDTDVNEDIGYLTFRLYISAR